MSDRKIEGVAVSFIHLEVAYILIASTAFVGV